MPTKFYLHTEAAPYTPATIRGSWNDTAGQVTRRLSAQKDNGGSITTVARAETNASSTWGVLLYRGVSGPLAAQTISGTMDVVIGVLESSSLADFYWRIHAYITEGDSDNVRLTLINGYVENTTNEWPTSATALALQSAQAVAGAITQGDRLVVELGYIARNSVTTSRTGTLYYGSQNSSDGTILPDLAVSDSATIGAGHLVFSEDLVEYTDDIAIRPTQVMLKSLNDESPSIRTSQVMLKSLNDELRNIRISQVMLKSLESNNQNIVGTSPNLEWLSLNGELIPGEASSPLELSGLTPYLEFEVSNSTLNLESTGCDFSSAIITYGFGGYGYHNLIVNYGFGAVCIEEGALYGQSPHLEWNIEGVSLQAGASNLSGVIPNLEFNSFGGLLESQSSLLGNSPYLEINSQSAQLLSQTDLSGLSPYLEWNLGGSLLEIKGQIYGEAPYLEFQANNAFLFSDQTLWGNSPHLVIGLQDSQLDSRSELSGDSPHIQFNLEGGSLSSQSEITGNSPSLIFNIANPLLDGYNEISGDSPAINLNIGGAHSLKSESNLVSQSPNPSLLFSSSSGLLGVDLNLSGQSPSLIISSNSGLLSSLNNLIGISPNLTWDINDLEITSQSNIGGQSPYLTFGTGSYGYQSISSIGGIDTSPRLIFGSNNGILYHNYGIPRIDKEFFNVSIALRNKFINSIARSSELTSRITRSKEFVEDN